MDRDRDEVILLRWRITERLEIAVCVAANNNCKAEEAIERRRCDTFVAQTHPEISSSAVGVTSFRVPIGYYLYL